VIFSPRCCTADSKSPTRFSKAPIADRKEIDSDQQFRGQGEQVRACGRWLTIMTVLGADIIAGLEAEKGLEGLKSPEAEGPDAVQVVAEAPDEVVAVCA